MWGSSRSKDLPQADSLTPVDQCSLFQPFEIPVPCDQQICTHKTRQMFCETALHSILSHPSLVTCTRRERMSTGSRKSEQCPNQSGIVPYLHGTLLNCSEKDNTNECVNILRPNHIPSREAYQVFMTYNAGCNMRVIGKIADPPLLDAMSKGKYNAGGK